MRHHQESEIEFVNEATGLINYPVARSVIVSHYGGSMEECVTQARGAFGLDPALWRVVRYEGPQTS